MGLVFVSNCRLWARNIISLQEPLQIERKGKLLYWSWVSCPPKLFPLPGLGTTNDECWFQEPPALYPPGLSIVVLTVSLVLDCISTCHKPLGTLAAQP